MPGMIWQLNPALLQSGLDLKWALCLWVKTFFGIRWDIKKKKKLNYISTYIHKRCCYYVLMIDSGVKFEIFTLELDRDKVKKVIICTGLKQRL